MFNSNHQKLWLTLGLFAVLAMNARLDYSNHSIRLAKYAEKGQIDLASEHKVRIGEDCNFNLKGQFINDVHTTDGTTKDFKLLQCDTGACNSLPNEIVRINGVDDIGSLAKRLEETIDKAGYECKDGKVVRKGRDTSRVAKKSTPEKKEDDETDHYEILESMAAKCDSEDEATEALDCIANVIEKALSSRKEFRKKSTAAENALKRFFTKKFRKEFKEAYKDKSSTVDRIDLWDPLARIMALSERNGKKVASSAKALKNEVIKNEASELIETRQQLNAVCSGLVGTTVNLELLNTFKCDTLKRQLPQMQNQVRFELQQLAMPTLANAYMDTEVAESPRMAQQMAYRDTVGSFQDLYNQFRQFSQNTIQGMTDYTFRNARMRATSPTKPLPTLNDINSTITFDNSAILKNINVPAPASPAVKSAPTHGPRVSTNSRTARGN